MGGVVMAGWIALSDRDMPPAPDGTVLDSGVFVLELALPLEGSAVLLDYRAPQEVPRAFSVFHDAATGISILHRRGKALVRHSLTGPLPTEGGTARILLRWDTPAHSWTLRFEVASSGHVLEASGRDPIPFALADLHAMTRITGAAQRHPAVLWFGATQGRNPPDRAPWIGLRTPIVTPDGLRPAAALRCGDPVLTRDRGMQPLQSVRRLDLPSRGHFTPVLLRAPYFAAGVDLLVSADQMVALSGAEVEYLFAEDEVLAEARHLIDGRSAMLDTRRAATSCVSLDLGYPDLILSQGCALASADHGTVKAALPRRLLLGYEAMPLLALLGRGAAARYAA